MGFKALPDWSLYYDVYILWLFTFNKKQRFLHYVSTSGSYFVTQPQISIIKQTECEVDLCLILPETSSFLMMSRFSLLMFHFFQIINSVRVEFLPLATLFLFKDLPLTLAERLSPYAEELVFMVTFRLPSSELAHALPFPLQLPMRNTGVIVTFGLSLNNSESSS